jgi:hypothetical protein
VTDAILADDQARHWTYWASGSSLRHATRGKGRGGRIGAVRSGTWTCNFSSTHSTTALSADSVQADDVAELRLELRVGAELERLAGAPELQPVLPPHVGELDVAQAQLGGQRPR